jgi:hypothetical protein
MTSWRSAVGLVFILLMTLVTLGCDDNVGVGIGVSYPGAYWGGGATGPGIIVGGPAYR